MATQIETDASTVLQHLAQAPRDEFVDGAQISAATGLSPDRINDAVALLVDSGNAEWNQMFGTAPYDFGDAIITPRGRYEAQRLSAAQQEVTEPVPAIAQSARAPIVQARPPAPVGSPYGFTDEDWESAAQRKGHRDRLYVVFGHQSTSDCFDSDALHQNCKKMFVTAVARYNERHQNDLLALKFRALAAGYARVSF